VSHATLDSTAVRDLGRHLKNAQASFVIATIMPINTNTTIAIWVQIQKGDIATDSLSLDLLPPSTARGTIV